MIYFSSGGYLNSNIILPKEECLEELRFLRESFVHDPSKAISFSFINHSFDDKEIQLKKMIYLSDFLIDKYMLPVLYNSFSKLDSDYAFYILEKISSDYDFFIHHVFDKILFKEVDSYSISHLENAHKLNEKFGINDDYNQLLMHVSNADENSRVLQLTGEIRKKIKKQ